jgi:CPA1 family monovalent cation:H+ antiporter
MEPVSIVAAVAGLFLIIGLAEPVADRLRLPFTVVLAVIGALIGIAAVLAGETLADPAASEALGLLAAPVRSDLLLFVFLPTLLFQVALGLNLRRMLDDWVPILVLAVVAVIVATLAVGLALVPVTGIAPVACLLIGAIVSTTDPSAVVTIFRSIGAPQRLARIVEGESLLNDAAAIALFGFFLTFVMSGVPDPTPRDILVGFPWLLIGGAVAGWALARAWVGVIGLLGRFPAAQVSLSVALPYVAYLMAERGVGVSGVIAVVVAGLTLNLTGPGRLSPAVWTYLRGVWDMLAHWAGALIFLLAALIIPRLMAEARLADIGLVLVVVLAATAARVLVLSGMLPVLAWLRLSPRVERPYRLASLWGGLRGAVTLVLALAVTENPQVAPEVKRLVGILATGFTLFTLFVQGTTLRLVIRALGLDRLAPLDTALANQVIAVALQSVREQVATTAQEQALGKDLVRAEAKRFAERLDRAVEDADRGEGISDRDRITLGLVALAGREREMILEKFREQVISTRVVDVMLSDADRLIEATRAGGRNAYRQAGRRSLGTGRRARLAVVLHNRLGISGPLGRLTADRFETLIDQRMILHALHDFIDGRILRIHGRRVAELLHELLSRREEEVDSALQGLRLQFPGYAEELERRYIRRAALRYEDSEYDALREDGLIGPELHARLKARIGAERARLEERIALDLAVQKAELVRQFPLFADMDAAQLRRLERALKTRHVDPGTIVQRRGDTMRRVHFIASGAVEVEVAGHKTRLGRGEMFGQIAMLTKGRIRPQVTAITHSTLLTLDEGTFRRLLARHATLREAVVESARRRGVALDL